MRSLVVLLSLLLLVGSAFAEEHGDREDHGGHDRHAPHEEQRPGAQRPAALAEPSDPHAGHGHPHGLHFAHPNLLESPTPDRMLRLDYAHVREGGDEARSHADDLGLTVEYAFERWMGLELVLPYRYSDPDRGPAVASLDDLELGLKFASFAFEDRGIVWGGGVELVMPTGDDDKGIGSSRVWHAEPFANLGFRAGRFELVALGKLGVQINREANEPRELEAEYGVSLLYHVHPKVAGLLEFTGETALAGDERGHTMLLLAPGVKLRPGGAGSAFEIGLHATLPASSRRDRSWGAGLSLFWHF